ncbi:type IV pilin protein [Variovorax sp. J22P168]|uniref:type IV pilin protein n=1 Tax=Variovorax jilinensis TaxID=3053513 RepID=UPI002574A90F|nr:type IV pilin protein [Variovorax sp. J22P168]MDM0012058.1 type IV pilin protein [Variovorax sp. J22P168]
MSDQGKRRSGRRPARGFTLIETLIVLALLAVLAAVALPIYDDTIRRGRRSEARGTLLQAAHWLERFATANGTYPGEASHLPGAFRTTSFASYRIAYEPRDAQGSGYTLTALPLGAQATDRCGGFTLDDAGVRGLTVADASDSLKAECWIR